MSIQIQAIAIVHKQVYACCKGGLLYILVIVSYGACCDGF